LRRPNSLEMGRSYLRGQIDCTHRTRPAGNAFRSGQFYRTCCTGGMGSRMLCSSYVCSNCRRNIVCRDNWLLCALVVRISCKAQHPGNFVPNDLFHRTCCTGGMGNRMICSSYVGWNCTRNIPCQGRYDSGTLCFFDRALHLCIPCNNWGNLYIRLRGANRRWSRQTRNGKPPLLR
jgi:hypothetical protein